jgi:hypothetical protein
VSCCNNLVLVQPDNRQVWEERSSDRLNCSSGWVNQVDGRIMASERKQVTTRREGDTVDPSSCATGELSTDSVERKFLAPWRRSRPMKHMYNNQLRRATWTYTVPAKVTKRSILFINTLDERRKDSSLCHAKQECVNHYWTRRLSLPQLRQAVA